jgi:hypothetical protein
MPASRHQDHTTSPSASMRVVFAHPYVHRIPHPTFVTMANAPLSGGTGEPLDVICPTSQAKAPATRWHDGQISRARRVTSSANASPGHGGECAVCQDVGERCARNDVQSVILRRERSESQKMRGPGGGPSSFEARKSAHLRMTPGALGADRPRCVDIRIQLQMAARVTGREANVSPCCPSSHRPGCRCRRGIARRHRAWPRPSRRPSKAARALRPWHPCVHLT